MDRTGARSETAEADRGRAGVWLAACAAVAAVGLATRVHNAFWYNALSDFDGPGHALNVVALHEGRLPDPSWWAGFHPPLYHAVGAALWALLPESVPVHVTLRLLSGAAGAAAALVVLRGLRRFVPPVDAAVIALLVLCAPVATIAGSMLGNETTCMLFVTAALVRLSALPADPRALPRHALVTALPLALGVLTKSTAILGVGVAALAYASRARGAPRPALAAAGLAAVLPALALAPHAARMVGASGGSPLAIVSGAALSSQARAVMRAQPPGERHVSDYFSLPWATFFAPEVRGEGMDRSVPGMLYASTWADGHGQFLPATDPKVLLAEVALCVTGLLPTALAVAGAVRIARRPGAWPGAGFPMLYAALLLVAFVRYTWVLPAYSAVKASYLSSAAFPAALALGAGLSSLRGFARDVARFLLVLLALGASLVLWHGWWG